MATTEVAVPFVAGCGNETVDATEIEQQIQTQLSTATADVVSVSCPEDVKGEEGATFECTGGRQTTLAFAWEDDAGSVDASSIGSS